MLTSQNYADLTAKAQALCPGAKVVRKQSSWLMWAIHGFFCGVTFGSYRSFMSRFATSIGSSIYIPEEWGVTTVDHILPHECRHIWQSRKGWHLGFALFYLFFPLPFKLAWGRFWSELDADREEWKAQLAAQGEAAFPTIRASAARRAVSVCSVDYFWSWPKSWGTKRYAEEAEKVIAGR